KPFSTALTWPLTFLPRGISVPSGAVRSSASLALKCLPCCSRLVSSLSSRRIRKVVPSGMVCGGMGALEDSSAASGRAASRKAKHQSRERSVIIGLTSGFPIPEIGCARQREMLPVSCRTEEHVREASGKLKACLLACKRASGAPGAIRTPDLLLRRQSLYPPAVRARHLYLTRR